MASLVKSSISQAIGDSLIQDIYLGKSKFYYCLGRTYPWDVEDSPNEAIDTEKYDISSRRDIVYMKRIDGTSMSFVVPRINYEQNKKYEIYDDTISLEGVNFYVMNSDYNVYKCLYNNNGGLSTVEPYGVSQGQIGLSDGYVWQFVYAITPALRAKFLTPEFMPIYNAITERYYSRGSLTSIIINSSGTNYDQATTSIQVSGDGFLEDNPVKLTSSIQAVAGSGYATKPLAETEDIYPNATSFSSGLSCVIGQNIKVSDGSGVRFYRAENTGTLGSTIPTHHKSTVLNGDVSLKHTGSKPYIDVTYSSSKVGSVVITDGGFGYTSRPNVTKSSPGTGATLSSSLDGDTVSNIEVITGGSGYTTETIVIAPPVSSVAFVATTPYTEGQIISNTNGYYYKVDASGTSGATQPLHTTGTASNGTLILTVVAKIAVASAILGSISDAKLTYSVESCKVINGGSGYNQLTATCVFVGGTPIVPATANAVVSGGAIVRIDISNPGYGYKTVPTLQITGGGTGATFNVTGEHGYGYREKKFITFTAPEDNRGQEALYDTIAEKTEAILEPIISDGMLRGIKIVDAGVGYTNAKLNVVDSGDGTGASISPLFASGDLRTLQSQVELLAEPGTVSSIFVENAGSNITAISLNVVGDGSGVELLPVVSLGTLTEIKVITPGSNYTYLDIEISVNPDATIIPVVRAILSPRRGHASDPLKELYTKSVALFTAFSEENNNGFIIDNAFSQVSIIKNPEKYGESYLLDSKTASACISVSANVSAIPLQENVMCVNTRTNSNYRVTSFNSTNILLQYINNFDLVVGDVILFDINNNTYTTTIIDISEPSVDKFSGDLLYIDNLLTFRPSASQAVSVTTTINLI